MILPVLFIAQSSQRGRGVFTSQTIPANTTIEIAPVLVLCPEHRIHAEKTLLYDYIFEWGTDSKSACVALGYVSMYNHSAANNCSYLMDFDALTITITTLKEIASGEELFINYNQVGEEDQPVWFNVEA